jgi:hypothetical protein
MDIIIASCREETKTQKYYSQILYTQEDLLWDFLKP